MRRTPLLVLLVGAIAATALPSSAATPRLDGKTKKSYAFTFTASTPQAHPIAETYGDVDGVDDEVIEECVAPRCYAFPFEVAPAKGVSPVTPLSVRIAWTSRTSRFWLKLVDITGKSPTIKAECFSFYVTNGTAATVRVASAKPGRKYAVWATVQQLVTPDTVKGTVSYPATHKPAANPGSSPSELFLNGCNA